MKAQILPSMRWSSSVLCIFSMTSTAELSLPSTSPLSSAGPGDGAPASSGAGSEGPLLSSLHTEGSSELSSSAAGRGSMPSGSSLLLTDSVFPSTSRMVAEASSPGSCSPGLVSSEARLTRSAGSSCVWSATVPWSSAAWVFAPDDAFGYSTARKGKKELQIIGEWAHKLDDN